MRVLLEFFLRSLGEKSPDTATPLIAGNGSPRNYSTSVGAEINSTVVNINNQFLSLPVEVLSQIMEWVDLERPPSEEYDLKLGYRLIAKKIDSAFRYSESLRATFLRKILPELFARYDPTNENIRFIDENNSRLIAFPPMQMPNVEALAKTIASKTFPDESRTFLVEVDLKNLKNSRTIDGLQAYTEGLDARRRYFRIKLVALLSILTPLTAFFSWGFLKSVGPLMITADGELTMGDCTQYDSSAGAAYYTSGSQYTISCDEIGASTKNSTWPTSPIYNCDSYSQMGPWTREQLLMGLCHVFAHHCVPFLTFGYSKGNLPEQTLPNEFGGLGIFCENFSTGDKIGSVIGMVLFGAAILAFGILTFFKKAPPIPDITPDLGSTNLFVLSGKRIKALTALFAFRGDTGGDHVAISIAPSS